MVQSEQQARSVKAARFGYACPTNLTTPNDLQQEMSEQKTESRIS
jgi:hypothetical protein